NTELTILFNLQICIDYGILFLIIYHTGFLENPFVFFFVFHIMLTSFIFTKRLVLFYMFILVVLFSVVTVIRYYDILNVLFTVFSLRTIPEKEIIIVRNAIALDATLIITAYLVTDIKHRIIRRGKLIELELNKYKTLERAKSNFILQVTHELRGPLAALKGYHEMMLKGIAGEIQEKTKTIIGKADRRTRNLITIIDEMIDYAYMKSEEDIEFQKTPVNIREILEANVDMFEGAAKQKNIKLLLVCPKFVFIAANSDLLNIIMSNLVTNAIKYSDGGTTVTIAVDYEGSEVHIQVKDEGMGIESSELPNIFEEFYRTRRAREVDRDGTGLGLSIVKKAVDSLGGRVTVYSELNKGTSFHMYFKKDINITSTEVGNEQKNGTYHRR
ncbi:MAG: HAMP domain-containing histidine kinase, partial [Spirochaetales bacterium]